MFADRTGMTLYTFDRDEGKPGKSVCNGDCALLWPPLLAGADAQPQPGWTIIQRDDGTSQWAFQGKPLYRYKSDAFPGATFGEGVGTVWHVAFQHIPVPGGVGIGPAVAGQVLTDAKGLTLYSSEADHPGRSACADRCLETWWPVAAPELANPFGDFSVVVRADGFRQWAFKGKPLYRHIDDVAPGETTGERVRGWHAVVLEPAPPLPSWARVQHSDAGELIANAQGLTIYTHEVNPNNRRLLANRPAFCKDRADECYDPDFVPFLAAPDAKPTGVWSLVKLSDGTQQWAYKGMKVFTNVNDRKPGEFKGIRFGGDRSWATVMRSGQPMQGTQAGG
jgi:predicted lipoprotein with Yx(FWY)xxD motif